MTVAELIEKLSEMPPDMPVMVAPDLGPGQASTARSVVVEFRTVWITGEDQ